MKKLILLTAISFFAVTTHAQLYPEMINVEGGIFKMGGPEGQEQPTHTVTLGSYRMGKYEVTVAEYKVFCTAAGRFMPTAPTWGWNEKHPMVNVSFDDAIAYCKWLSETTGKTYRLPTEAEWEYAARGGNKSDGYMYAGSNVFDEVGWNVDNAGGQTQECGRKKPNELGLYDMSGNASEWCKDWYSFYSNGPSVNPQGPSWGDQRVMRGGSWEDKVYYTRVAHRWGMIPFGGYKSFGFRVVVPQ